jgi:TATA-box binding protein (TBP) (component of TFIID and TFIIIB)
VEFGQEKNRGTYPKKRRPNVYGRKSFDNQVTLVYRFREGYAPNIKVFRNGNIQMTGIRCPEDGHSIIDSIANEVRYIATETPAAAGITDVSMMNPGDFKIRMINSDFSFTFRIRRKDLHTLLISSKYNTISSFQPGTYPGVKIQYFWNMNSRNRCGRCECSKPCHGRGDNATPVVVTPHVEGAAIVAENQCKKVTISVFESGKILITGATSYTQIDEAYAYIVKVIQDNIYRIRKQSIPLV